MIYDYESLRTKIKTLEVLKLNHNINFFKTKIYLLKKILKIKLSRLIVINMIHNIQLYIYKFTMPLGGA